MSSPLTDLRYTLRQLRRSPGFALTAVITLALGIGATTAMYSIVRSTLLAPLPYPHPEELIGIGFAQPGDPPTDTQTGEAGALIQSHASSFASLGIADGGPLGANFSDGKGTARSIQAMRVSATYLPTLGVTPLLGHPQKISPTPHLPSCSARTSGATPSAPIPTSSVGSSTSTRTPTPSSASFPPASPPSIAPTSGSPCASLPATSAIRAPTIR